MKRWLVVLLVVLAVLVLVSPGLIGQLAQQNIEKGLTEAANESGRATVTTESYETGWFTSEGRYRIVFEEGGMREALQAGEPGIPAILLTTHIQHGLLPLGDFLPGIANAESTAQLDTGAGEVVDIPGVLNTHIGLNGDTTFRYRADKDSFVLGDGNEIDWDGADIVVRTDATATEVSVDGKVRPLQLRNRNGDLMNVGTIVIRGEQQRMDLGFDVGQGSFDLDRLWARDADGETSIEGLHFDSTASLEEDGAAFLFRSSVSDMDLPGIADMSYDVEISLARLDPEGLGRILNNLRNANPETGMYPGFEQDALDLLAGGALIEATRLNVSAPQGNIDVTINLDISPQAPGSAATWLGVLMASDASVELSVPAMLVDLAQVASPEMATLMQMGLLIQDGENYRMEARFKKGIFTVNGAPLPLPVLPTQ
jgi:uncharacterized protein YdgA (DUF945 family)